MYGLLLVVVLSTCGTSMSLVAGALADSGVSACSLSTLCVDGGSCVLLELEGGAGFFCAAANNPCGALACRPGTSCLCLLSNPPHCGCGSAGHR